MQINYPNRREFRARDNRELKTKEPAAPNELASVSSPLSDNIMQKENGKKQSRKLEMSIKLEHLICFFPRPMHLFLFLPCRRFLALSLFFSRYIYKCKSACRKVLLLQRLELSFPTHGEQTSFFHYTWLSVPFNFLARDFFRVRALSHLPSDSETSALSLFCT